MTRRHCDTGRVDCPHIPECIWECHYDNAEVRKIKPYPAIFVDIEPVPDTWHTVGTVMLTAIFAALAAICVLMFFTGFWVWSLLI